MSRETWTFGSLLRLRCPVCGADTFTAGWYRTAKACSRCGQDFLPEQGFFAGAIYPMYGIGAFFGGIAGVVAGLLGAGLMGVVLSAALTLIALSPWIFWVSRLGFLHTNHRFFKDRE